MLTPQFKISQSQESIIVVIRVPYVKISACEFYIEQYSFKFYLKPYLLNLTFQQPLLQVEQPSKATYYHEKHLLQVHLRKKNKGEHFENLNLLSKILNKNKQKEKTKRHPKTLIQVMDEPSVVVLNENINKNPYGYGFCNNYTKVFNQLQEECYQIFNFNPQQVSRQDRARLSAQISQSVFDQQAYLYDKYQNEQQIERILQNEQTITGIKAVLSKYNSKQPQSYEQFKSHLKILNKQIIVGKTDKQRIIKQLFSICFTYVYELVCMEGDMSVESAKTINNCSSLFSCCVDYEDFSILEVIKDCCKRCLSYSLYKNIKVCQKTLRLLIIYMDQTFICAVLVSLRAMFEKSQPRYLLNTIFLNDYLIYCFKQNLDAQLLKVKGQLKGLECSQDFLAIQFEQDSEPEQQQKFKINQKQSSKNKQKPLIQQIIIKETQKDQHQIDNK